MQILENVGLSKYSTMRLGGNAKYLVEVSSESEASEALVFAHDKKLSVHIVGEGSNTVFGDKGFDGLVIANKIKGIIEKTEGDTLILELGAGEKWDNIVAAPVQNIGAYGQQISDSIKKYKNIRS
jgi:UDP-N-acetylmuramate dehydrogenase